LLTLAPLWSLHYLRASALMLWLRSILGGQHLFLLGVREAAASFYSASPVEGPELLSFVVHRKRWQESVGVGNQ